MSEEKRTFSRVSVRLKGHARIMHSLDSSPIFTGDAVDEPSASEALFHNSKLPEDLTRFLAEMDRKLERVLGLLSQDRIRSDFPVSVEIMEISAAGVKLRTQEKFAIGTPLELVIQLSYAPLRMAGSKGRIVGMDEDTGLYRFEFVDTRAADMEAIVRFVFREQREQIRNAKM
ncbi:PilZ domain-containing protein [Pseudodesulfovibrio sp.]|uniref:PilZ domain-containing protein n=1 Tax=Pseudodesulfovibrio sp. TaxID=2035812 RepID=UPI00261C993B|nr:PilZ domain-containing protein [Pseudodesulfovibrio sp.]MDD3312571.1 PilZ domain-containing protein [Pseudodesulfovibrio sp.]